MNVSLSTIALACLLPLAVSLTSCATAVRGTHQELEVFSEPSQADVTLSNGQRGRTPASFQVPRKKPITVEVTKPGFQRTIVSLTPVLSGGGAATSAGNIILGGVVGAGVDTVSGALFNLRPNPVSVTLKPGTGTNYADGFVRDANGNIPQPPAVDPSSASTPDAPRKNRR
jgi:hypothetical protein